MELLITFLVIGIIFLVNVFINIDNKILEALINLIPLIYPTFKLWRSNLRKNIKWLSLMSKDGVGFKYYVQYRECSINREKYIEIVNAIKENDKKTRERRFEQSLNDENLYFSRFTIYNKDDIRIVFDNQENDLNIIYNGGRTYKYVLDKVKGINNILNNELKSVVWNETICELRIDFDSNDNSENPFIKKFFSKFKEHDIRIRFKGKNNSIIELNNESIIIKNNSSTNNLIDDIVDELECKGIKDFI
ncbi:hypothetical protein [Clostridium perfringens]|uniref:hypothetical protein n=1 Tax=Clostridium perfringens TaxID=1502 RepID=UPI00285C6EB5|nr:hypothetical protein [Clostridium perfringens]